MTDLSDTGARVAALGENGVNASPILIMHTAYEAAGAAYNAVDTADTALGNGPGDDRLRFRYRDGKDDAEREQDALRTAILYQVPTDWTDAFVLLFHINNQQDLVVNGTAPTDAEKNALAVAIDTLFDFMARTVAAEHERIGDLFLSSTLRVWTRRNLRTGKVEG